MAIYNTYIQQIRYDGTSYEKGSVVDLLNTFNIICREFPFKRNPKAKDLPKRDWAGADGVDVYIPDTVPMKDYEVEVTFLYARTQTSTIEVRDAQMRTDIANFIDFLYGRKKGVETDGVKSGRLSVYNEYVGMGRKDIRVTDIENDEFYMTDDDPDAVAEFKVKFEVNDPTTEVTPTYGTYNGQKRCTQLNFD